MDSSDNERPVARRGGKVPFSLQTTVNQPGLIWGCEHGADGISFVEQCSDKADHFRWLHLNLADQRSHAWLRRAGDLGPAALALLLDHDDAHQRMVVEEGVVGIVLHDFERDFDSDQTNKIGAIHIVLTPDNMYTGRYHPVHTPDVIRQRIKSGSSIADPVEALDLLFDTVADSMAAVVLDLSTLLNTAEDEFLTDQKPPDTKELADLRRRAARLHRMIGGMRTAMHRLESDPGLPKTFKPLVSRHHQRLGALDADVGAAQSQLRLLRDELELQATQQTNQNLYLLSIMSSMMLPATVVTGFFGMNTGGLPLSQGWSGSIVAALVAIAASGGTYLLLKMFGRVRT